MLCYYESDIHFIVYYGLSIFTNNWYLSISYYNGIANKFRLDYCICSYKTPVKTCERHKEIKLFIPPTFHHGAIEI